MSAIGPKVFSTNIKSLDQGVSLKQNGPGSILVTVPKLAEGGVQNPNTGYETHYGLKGDLFLGSAPKVEVPIDYETYRGEPAKHVADHLGWAVNVPDQTARYGLGTITLPTKDPSTYEVRVVDLEKIAAGPQPKLNLGVKTLPGLGLNVQAHGNQVSFSGQVTRDLPGDTPRAVDLTVNGRTFNALTARPGQGAEDAAETMARVINGRFEHSDLRAMVNEPGDGTATVTVVDLSALRDAAAAS
jgi:hypothetical protein